MANAILAIDSQSPEAIDMRRRLDPSAIDDLSPIDALPTPPDTDTSDDLFKDVAPEPSQEAEKEIPDIDLKLTIMD